MSRISLGNPIAENYREYISVKLLDSLRQSERYLFKVFLLKLCGADLASSTGSFGVYFSSFNPSDSVFPGDFPRLPYTPQLNHDPLAFYTDTVNWQLYLDTLIATGNEVYLTFGNFNSLENSPLFPPPGYEAAYYLDDFSLVLIDSISSIEETLGVGLSVSPNPTDGQVQVHWNLKNAQVLDMSIMDMRGVRLMGQKISTSSSTIDMSGLADGIYLFAVTDATGARIWHQKVVVQKQ